METIRWKRLLIAKDRGQLRQVTLQLEANDIRHAIGSHRPWRAAEGEPWLMVPAADLSRAMALFPALTTGTSNLEVHGDSSHPAVIQVSAV
jgi:hypothetical protein